MGTKVENIHRLKHHWGADPRYVYIGRRGHGHDGYFGNPFVLKAEEDREAVYREYVNYLKDRVRSDKVFRARVRGLAGKTLVCFCAPLRCHGHALAIMADHLAKQD